MSNTSNNRTASVGRSTFRSELEELIKEFQSKLGNNWDKYHESLSLFLVGKLSRNELVAAIGPILKNELRQDHNRLLLLNLANSLKDGPLDYQNDFITFWNKKANKTKNVKSSQYEKFKQNIMGLSIKQRRRIKSITRESGKKGKLNASITFTRQALLPKIPMISDQEQQQIRVNNLVQWQQDVLNGINAPIATETYEIPDYDYLSSRVVMIMREHGLTGGLNPQVLEIILLGLEVHLKGIIENAIDVARYRKKKYTRSDFLCNTTEVESPGKKRKFHEDLNDRKLVTLNISDLYDTFEIFPHLIEPSGAKIRLSSLLLENDDAIAKEREVELTGKKRTKMPRINGTSHSHKNVSFDQNDPSKKPKAENTEAASKSGTEKQESDNLPDDATNAATSKANNLPNYIGTNDELKLVLQDLISEA